MSNEANDTGGDVGGAVASAPQESPTADVFGASSASQHEHSMSMSSETGGEGGNIFNQLYTSEGGLAENYTDLLEQNGMGNLTNTVAKYKSPDGLLKGAANLVNFAGKKVEGVIVPNEGSSEHEIAEYRKAIGVPESSTAYDIAPENMPEGLEWNDEVAGFWQGKFHELGIGQDQASQIAQAYSDFTGQQLDQAKATISEREAQHMEGLRAEVKGQWGDAYDDNMQKAVNMADVAGFDFDNPDDMAAMRNPKVLNMLLEKHNSVQEGSLPRNSAPSVNGGFREQANQLAMQYPNMQAAPMEVQQKYLELRKLQARG